MTGQHGFQKTSVANARPFHWLATAHRLGAHRFVGWAVVAYVAVFTLFAGRAGLRLRDDAWQTTRSIHFQEDISNAFHWGSEVNAVANASFHGNGDPTMGQLIQAEAKIYRDLVRQIPDGNYELDYPPYRLLTVSLWRRQIAREYPGLTNWPGRWQPCGRRPDADRDATEDLAGPLILMNTLAEAATALLAAALVGVWVWRSGRRDRATHAGGVLAFMLTAAALVFALPIAQMAIPAPPPSVAIARPPSVNLSGNQASASVFGLINPQGAVTRCYVQWGTAAGHYAYQTQVREIGGATAQPFTGQLTNLPVGATIHYQIVARNDQFAAPTDFGRGTSRSDDATLVTEAVVQPAQPQALNGAVWLSFAEWIPIGLVFVAMCWAMRRMNHRHRAWASAVIVGLLIWFDPTLRMDGHVYPQWDSWLLPPYLAAVLLASFDCWLLAGMMMGIGMMFKGQFLIGAPVLLIWPLAGLRWGAAARLITGFALMAGLLLSPWIVLDGRAISGAQPSVYWIVALGCVSAIGILATMLHGDLAQWAAMLRPIGRAFMRRLPFHKPRPAADQDSSRPVIGLQAMAVSTTLMSGLLLAIIALWRSWPMDTSPAWYWLIALIGLLLVAPSAIPQRSFVPWSAAVIAASLWLSPWLFHNDWSWETVGYEYGTKKFDNAAMGRGSNGNLPGIMHQRFNWNTHDPAITLPLPNLASLLYLGQAKESVPQWMHALGISGAGLTLDMKQAMLALYFVMVILCGIAAAAHSRRHDPRFLAAVAAPWVLMPNLLCQMMSRYHLWGAVLSAMLIGIRPELGVLYALLTALAAGMIFDALLYDDPTRSPQLFDLMSRLSPDSGWIMLMAAAVVLFLARTPGRPSTLAPSKG
ncbi:MAG: hypothetical protein JWM57_3804 [Phycisphaerales bacterium]|nr:hypothetical protein [Phycisphaerales bacterium]